MSNLAEIRELLIVSPAPLNIERGELWFTENSESIKKAVNTNSWWRDNACFIEKDLVIKPSEFCRRLLNLGYERSSSVHGRGVFAVHGGVIELWPIHLSKPYAIEFWGNKIISISEREYRPEISKPKSVSHNIEKLESGAFVVHVDHGIGIYRGITPETQIKKFFIIEYAPSPMGREPDRLFVPTSQKDRLTPYMGFETPRIHRLGGSLWYKTRKKAREDAEKLARELLALYARREVAERTPFAGDPMFEQEMRQTFTFTETEDQLKTEEEIKKDLSGSRPMDRVLCGDVGFGKTEIALRAALRVIASGAQVALLCPTTILASQHEKTFAERINNLPVKLRMLSRLTPREDKSKILKDLESGTIDCVVGTHRLLSRDIRFRNLGLVIIDEEQRFGVKQKERFKDLRAEVDILSLSATPIPRTLSLALAKIRDISLISTPPPERLSIITSVLPHTQKTIQSAIEFELERGGQIYFLHNRIETIGSVRQKLQKTKLKSGELRIETIHGRMAEKEIINAMDNFRSGRSNLLLATTIIENGLDISSANTLIVDDATRIGLAQAHQLRGRIGRSRTQGFAYFLYRPHRLTPTAEERLEALREYSKLGSGYEIALRDLEIRGAGNILGREQSGTINKVGLNLYCQMLAEAVENQKDGY